MSDTGVYCPIRFGANGGTFDEYGAPIDSIDEDEIPIRGKCWTAFDCGTCQFMRQWLAARIADNWGVAWECVECIVETKQEDIENGLIRKLPGFYQSGRSYEDSPLTGCTRCGRETDLLQLVLRRNRE